MAVQIGGDLLMIAVESIFTHSGGSKLLYFFVGISVFVIDFLAYRPLSPLAFLTLVLITTSWILSVWYPVAGSVAVIVLSVFINLSPGFSLASSLLSVPALAKLISRKKFYIAALCAIITAAGYYFEPVDRKLGFYFILVFGHMLISVSLGVGVMSYRNKYELLEKESALALQRVSTQLATTLHDTVLTDLTKVLIHLRELKLSAQGEPLAQDLGVVEEGFSEALHKLRQTVKMMEKPFNASAIPSVSETLTEARQQLKKRRIELQVDLHDDSAVVQQLDVPRQQLLSLFLREGLTNCLKYSPRGSTVSISVDDDFDGRVEFIIHSELDEKTQGAPDDSLSSSFGIPALDMRARSLGGAVIAGAVDNRWLLALSLPVMAVSSQQVTL